MPIVPSSNSTNSPNENCILPQIKIIIIAEPNAYIAFAAIRISRSLGPLDPQEPKKFVECITGHRSQQKPEYALRLSCYAISTIHCLYA